VPASGVVTTKAASNTAAVASKPPASARLTTGWRASPRPRSQQRLPPRRGAAIVAGDWRPWAACSDNIPNGSVLEVATEEPKSHRNGQLVFDSSNRQVWVRLWERKPIFVLHPLDFIAFYDSSNPSDSAIIFRSIHQIAAKRRFKSRLGRKISSLPGWRGRARAEYRIAHR
jgi:hypothetical protein